MPASLQDDALAYIAQRAPGHVPDAHSVNGVMAFLAQNPSMRPSYSGPPGYSQDDRASMDALVDRVMQQSDGAAPAPASARAASGASQQGLEPPMPGRKPGLGDGTQPSASMNMAYHSRPADDGLPLSFGAPRVGQTEPEVDDEDGLDMPWFIPMVGAGAAGAAEYMGQAPRPPFGPGQAMYPNSGGNLPQLPPPAPPPDLIDDIMGGGPSSFGPYSGGAQYDMGAWPDADAAGNVHLGPVAPGMQDPAQLGPPAPRITDQGFRFMSGPPVPMEGVVGTSPRPGPGRYSFGRYGYEMPGHFPSPYSGPPIALPDIAVRPNAFSNPDNVGLHRALIGAIR